MRWSRIGKRLATLGLGLALTLGTLAPAAPPASTKVSTVYSNSRAFKIPFTIKPEDRPRYKQVQLWVSSDFGATWERTDATTPDRPSFTFRSQKDGEYWFAVRTLDTKNRLSPADDLEVEPIIKVIVDTVPPQLNLEGLPRRGSVASVRWEVVEDRLDPGAFFLEYMAVGSADWSQATVRKPTRIGRESWDAGTAEALKVRMSVSDRAGNVKVVSLNLPDGLPRGNSESAGDLADLNTPPPRGTFASSEGERSAPPPIASGPPPMPGIGEDPGPSPTSGTGSNVAGPVSHFNPFQSNEAPSGRGQASSAAPTAEPSNPPILVASPKFGLKYEVEDSGPNGPATVELYMTTDGGRNWFKRGDDPDRASPFPVDLGGEGTFGIKLVAKSSANQGDQPPTPGEVPLTIVEVDSTPPSVKLEPIKVSGTKAYISWQAIDSHPASKPVMISVKPDTPDAAWQPITPSPIENTGQFTWVLPPNCPPRVHFRVDVVDSLGNRGFAETIETGAILVDRTKPKGRILGLDPIVRDGTGPSARPIR